MVKGTSRQVIVVDSPDPELFEQAIFIVRGGSNRAGVTQEQLVREACHIVREYCRGRSRRRACLRLKAPLLWSAIGAGGVALGWVAGMLVRI